MSAPGLRSPMRAAAPSMIGGVVRPLTISVLCDITLRGGASDRNSRRVTQRINFRLHRVCQSGAPRGIRTPNLLIRSQMLYPLS